MDPTPTKQKTNNIVKRYGPINPFGAIVLFYDKDHNWFTDEDGFVIYDIFEFVPVYVIEEYLSKNQEPCFVYKISPDVDVEIYRGDVESVVQEYFNSLENQDFYDQYFDRR